MAIAVQTANNALWQISLISARVGAEILGIDITRQLEPPEADAIRKALLDHKVLFFRGFNLEDAEHERFSRIFGAPVPHPTVQLRDGIANTHVLELDSAYGAKTNSWHTDVTFVPDYPAVCVLRAVTVPPFGGDTVWANTASAYLDLPVSLRRLADELRAVHTNLFDYAIAPPLTSDDKEQYARLTSTPYQTEHPVVRVHPETGERTLLLGHFVQKILGVNSAESIRLFRIFQEHITRLENTIRWRWRAGDLAVWDNRATQHYAINDYGDRHRIMRRIALSGDVPKGIDGRNSKLLE